MYGNDEIIFAMIPSVSEIIDYDGDNCYWVGLDLVGDSVELITRQARDEFFRDKQSTTDPAFR